MEAELKHSVAAGEILKLNKAREKPLSYYIRTYGCQQNSSDSEKLAGVLEFLGCVPASRAEESDIVIFNTCGVRHTANDRALGNIGALKLLKRRKKELIIGVCGCMAQQQGAPETLVKRFPFINMVFGTNLVHMLPEFLFRVIVKKERVLQPKQSDEFVEGLPVKRGQGPVCLVPVMHGCNNFCSYCVVPHVRGREHSREPEQVIAEVEAAVLQGKKEILLLGQNVNSYGRGLTRKVNFAQLLQRVANLDGEFRVRFLTSHPKDMSDELIEVVAQNAKVCKQVHLPLQSGSDMILQKMNRGYTKQQYLDLAYKLKKAMPECSLSSDIIVGFPGESREDFEETLQLVRELEFNFLFMFVFSKRPGTAAAELFDPVPAAEKKAWFEGLVKLQEEISSKKHAKQVGKKVLVLPDRFKICGEKTILAGKDEKNFLVEFEGKKSLVGQFVPVRITGATRRSLAGVVCAEKAD